MKSLIKSKWFIIYIVSLFATTGLIILGSFYLTEEYLEGSAVDITEIAGENVEEIVPLGKYKTIKILNGEKGLFLGEKTGKEKGWYLFDKDGNELINFSFDGNFEKKNDRYILFSGEDGYFIVNYDELPENNYQAEIKKSSYADLDENGENYILYNEENESYEVYSSDEKLLFEISYDDTDGGDSVKFAKKEGYLIKTEDNCDHIVNYLTGEDEYKAKKDSTVCDYVAGRWIIEIDAKSDFLHTVQYQILNDSYESEFDGRQSEFYYGNDKLLVARETYNKDLICDASGNQLECKEYGMPISATKDTIVLYDYKNECTNYVTIEEDQLKVVDKCKYYCNMDFEDGFAIAYNGKNIDTKDYKYDDFRTNEERKWGFIDKNMNPATKFVFSAVSETDNGFAVIGIKKKQGLIRLNEV